MSWCNIFFQKGFRNAFSERLKEFIISLEFMLILRTFIWAVTKFYLKLSRHRYVQGCSKWTSDDCCNHCNACNNEDRDKLRLSQTDIRLYTTHMPKFWNVHLFLFYSLHKDCIIIIIMMIILQGPVRKEERNRWSVKRQGWERSASSSGMGEPLRFVG
jgi:hypothetical protein